MILTFGIIIISIFFIGWYQQRKFYSKIDEFTSSSEKRTSKLQQVANEFEKTTNDFNALINNNDNK